MPIHKSVVEAYICERCPSQENFNPEHRLMMNPRDRGWRFVNRDMLLTEETGETETGRNVKLLCPQCVKDLDKFFINERHPRRSPINGLPNPDDDVDGAQYQTAAQRARRDQ